MHPRHTLTQMARHAAAELSRWVDEEEKLREAFEKADTETLAWREQTQREHPFMFETVDDDNRKCKKCNTTCFFSALACACSPEVSNCGCPRLLYACSFALCCASWTRRKEGGEGGGGLQSPLVYIPRFRDWTREFRSGQSTNQPLRRCFLSFPFGMVGPY